MNELSDGQVRKGSAFTKVESVNKGPAECKITLPWETASCHMAKSVQDYIILREREFTDDHISAGSVHPGVGNGQVTAGTVHPLGERDQMGLRVQGQISMRE